ncbi:SUMF1/EgtB/PvdO family nonheme iron enzyme [Aliihoeflea sp. 2WW]|uniref:SUMF1/EgtB/PvdO family nonheme iron enzyme n=1 Tax=Aliihoeflea sp. 2WW TaxID=1381123 RepID=UPI0004B8F0EA|nr:SUMF1/EgtB/PvdO family nonheme iron enzyme [Aliihoeflea sp. 2WW]
MLDTKRCLCFIACCILLALTSGRALARVCEEARLTAEVVARWHNPYPSADDFLLPLPLGMTVAFTPIGLSTRGLYGDERTTYTMGARETQLFETPLEVRVGSSITLSTRETLLLMGKYELSKAQYVAVLGRGNMRRGIETLVSRTLEPRIKILFSDFLRPGDPCENKFTSEMALVMTEPVTFLNYRSYIEFIDELNDYCINTPACRRQLGVLGRNQDYPGFVRLPTEHEWEFVARGGREFVAGRLTRDQLQGDVPALPEGKTIKDFAHVGSDPQRLVPIGSRDPLFGVYDILGNAEELMQNPFTAENGYGAVGAYVGRGGHYRMAQEELRVSRRVELTAFQRDEATGQFVTQYFPYTGLRLAMGYPIVGLQQRTGSNELAGDFKDTYVPPQEAGDRAGATIAEARDMGAITSKPSTLRDRVGGTDTLDIYRMTLRGYGLIQLEATSISGSVRIDLLDESETQLASATASEGAPAKLDTPPLMPGTYFLRVAPQGNTSAERTYNISLVTSSAPDTGVAQMTTAELAQAVRLGARQVITEQGFVGEGDRVDLYPMHDIAGRGGVVFTLSRYRGTATLAWYDEGQQRIHEVSGDGSAELELVVPTRRGDRGFLRVSADTGPGTVYALEAEARRPYDVMLTTARSPKNIARIESGKTHVGYLSSALTELNLLISLTDRKKVRVELSELSADVDLDILNDDDEQIESNHQRAGITAEFFQQDLDRGRYFARVRLKDRAGTSRFSITVYVDEPTKQLVRTPDDARRSAADLGRLSGSPISRVVNSAEAHNYYRFRVDGLQHVTVDVYGFTADVDIDLTLERNNRSVIAKSSNVGSEPESIQQRLQGGEYFLRLSRAGSATNSYFNLNISGFSQPAEYRFERHGDLVENSGDYQIRKMGNSCYLLTRAQAIHPQIGWRREWPVFKVGVERGDGSVWIALDASVKADGTDVYEANSATLSIDGQTLGRDTTVMFENAWLKPLTYSSDRSQTYVSNDAIRGFRRGSTMRVTGKSALTGEDVSVTYSLRGYTKAAQRINNLCGAKADWVWSN